jgi:hypothetical protein
MSKQKGDNKRFEVGVFMQVKGGLEFLYMSLDSESDRDHQYLSSKISGPTTIPTISY